MKLLRGKVPWLYSCYVDTELVGPLIAKDVKPLECSFPYQTLLVKGSISFKEGEEPKAIPDGSNQLKENLEKGAICYFTDDSKMCNQEFVSFSCVKASGEIRHQYWTTKFASIFIGCFENFIEIMNPTENHFAYVPTLELYSCALTRDR
jgi:hypothetical protein